MFYSHNRLQGLTFVLFLALLIHGHACEASATDDPLQTLALYVARTAANEAGFDSPRDVVLIYQVAMQNGNGDPARAVRWLRRHSARVNGNAPCEPRSDGRTRNCMWSRNLQWSDDKPAHWPGAWHPQRWHRQRMLALDVVYGRAPQRACAVDVVTWGARTDRDFSNGVRIPIDCGARNLGGATPAALAEAHAQR